MATLSGAEQITHERGRQRSVEGWTPEHDDRATDSEMASAAMCYIHHAISSDRLRPEIETEWPWDIEWYKPSDDPIRTLVKAGALIAAEIDRRQRAD